MNKKEILNALKEPFKSFDDELFKLADKTRFENVGDLVLLRGLIEFSNFCNKNCLYCGLRYENANCHRFRLNKEQIINYAKNAVELGLETVVLQSGEDFYYKEKDLIEIISEIKKLNIALALSVGERPIEEYLHFKEAGADRFLMRIETTDEKLYSKMHPKADFSKRKKTILKLKELGFELGTGSLVGLPEQSLNSIADDILFFKEVNADMVGVGPFIASPDTPLKNATDGSFELALKVVALTRIILPYANIPATTAMETIHPNGRILTLRSGANVVMPNIVDYEINKNYLLYSNKASNQFGVKETLNSIKDKIISINRIPK